MPPSCFGLSSLSTIVQVVVTVSPGRTGALNRQLCSRIGDRGAVEVHPGWRRHQGARERPVQDAATESRCPCVSLVDVQRVEVTEETGREHEVRLGHRERRAEGVADLHLVVVLALDHEPIVADRVAAGKEARMA